MVQMNYRREPKDFFDHAGTLLKHLATGGVFCTVADASGKWNVLTLGWGQVGPVYEGSPVCSIAITPLRYSWRFIEQVPHFTLCVPGPLHAEALALCGSASGRHTDKFAAAALTPLKGVTVHSPAILECPLIFECSVYARIAPPHTLLTQAHRRCPEHEQHTIYFAKVMVTYAWVKQRPGVSECTDMSDMCNAVACLRNGSFHETEGFRQDHMAGR
jgi:flavin reductase (DIM6/NTAB) family NADH-FMN oxidoreductase RutF